MRIVEIVYRYDAVEARARPETPAPRAPDSNAATSFSRR